MPNLTPQQVRDVLDELLSNADRLFTSAIQLAESDQIALARSVAILGLEETGKAIAVHRRRVAMVAGRERRDDFDPEFDYESASEVQDRIELAASGYFDEWRDLDSQDLYEDTDAWRDLRTVYPIDTPDTELFFSEEAEDDYKDIDSGITGENTKSPSRAEQAGHVWDDSLEGDPFPNIWLRTLWGDHRSKLDVVYEFLIDEEYWFGTGPSDPEENRELLAIVEAWSKNLNAYK